ncbi:hypothetical protein CF98_36770 [Halopseudomonas bauzanensis]|nr:hypothetical protein CF98_36770 [Halopseudomonas bauzanensis]
MSRRPSRIIKKGGKSQNCRSLCPFPAGIYRSALLLDLGNQGGELATSTDDFAMDMIDMAQIHYVID